MIKEFYVTRDIWMATWLDSQEVPILSVTPYGQWDRAEFRFSNVGDRAWELAVEFREGTAQVNIKRFRDSYRFVLDMAGRARRQHVSGEEAEENDLNGYHAAK